MSIVTTLTAVYADTKKPVISVRAAVRAALKSPKGIAVQEKYLNGTSPKGNALMDRGFAAEDIRKIAGELGFAIPASVKNAKVARVIMQEMKAAGIPMKLNGKIDIEKLTMTEPTGDAE